MQDPEQEETSGKRVARPLLVLLKRVKSEIRSDQVVLLGAGVAFYLFLAVIPGIIACVSLYGLFANPSEVAATIERVAGAAPSQAQQFLQSQIDALLAAPRAGLGAGAVLGILVAVYSASSGIRHLMEALTRVYDCEETRRPLRLYLEALAMTLGAVVFLALTAGLITVLPNVVSSTGIGSNLATAISTLEWPFLALVFLGSLAVVYRFGPNRPEPRWRWVSWGSAAALLMWIAGSILFELYTTNFSSYGKTYGSLAAVVVFMLWILLTTVSILVGAEIDVEIARRAAAE